MKQIINDKKKILRQICLISYDILAIALSSLFALLLRFELNYQAVEPKYYDVLWKYLPLNIIITIAIFALFRLYNSMWIYAGINELENIIAGCVGASVLQIVGIHLLNMRMPRSYYFTYTFALISLISVSRFIYRIIRIFIRKRESAHFNKSIMIIGAGEAGNMILNEILMSDHLHMTVKCIIDDDTDKKGKYIRGIKIVGGRDDILYNVKRYDIDEIIIAMPSVSKKVIREFIDICKETSCTLKTLPGIYQIVNDEVHISNLRTIEVEDLLGRDPIQVDIEDIMGYVNNKIVLVTGGGGSIGSELCRQIVRHKPKQLIIVDIYENNAYDIQNELLRNYPELDLTVLIASVRNTNRINKIFETYHPQIVYHAAAHKHVPLMELSPNEAIKNNVFGTLKTVKAADENGVERFVLISTDKAVNPTNIMGASKRICEMIIQTYNKKSKTEFVAVRFGNVLGSNGSVIPLFKKQIAAGGPITITHPDIIRYFMTIPEAVSLVLQAGAYAQGGEIFILDMGEPVKILDLAKNLIKLSGYVPEEDIPIVYTGLRPGEKLYEELLMDEEKLQNTKNKLIFIGKPIQFDEEGFLQQLENLEQISSLELDEIKSIIKEIVPTYEPENYCFTE